MSNQTEKVIVAKFGGSSVAKYPEKIKEIVHATDATRKFIVVSAPGKKNLGDEKLTDILFKIVDENIQEEKAVTLIIEKLAVIGIPFKTLEITKIIQEHLATKETLDDSQYRANIASLGENLSAILYASYLGATYLDPRELFVLETAQDHCDAKLDFLATQDKWTTKLPTLSDDLYVIPGYYGSCTQGNTALFSRGGSDLTGAYIAYFAHAIKYENFTDSPILAADPRTVDNPKRINTITFKELRDLTYSGFSILHQDVVKPLAERNIPIEIRGTAEFPQRGTVVVEEREAQEAVLGVAFASGFTPLKVYAPELNDINYVLADTLQIFKEFKIPIEHVSTGIDDISIVIETSYLTEGVLEKISDKIKKSFGSKFEIISYKKFHLGLLTVVGQGMRNKIGISGEIQKILAENNVNIYSINQSITERNIIYCIETKDATKALRGIYEHFIA